MGALGKGPLGIHWLGPKKKIVLRRRTNHQLEYEVEKWSLVTDKRTPMGPGI